MDGLEYRNGVLHAGEVPLPAIAEAVALPSAYVYSADGIRTALHRRQSSAAAMSKLAARSA